MRRGMYEAGQAEKEGLGLFLWERVPADGTRPMAIFRSGQVGVAVTTEPKSGAMDVRVDNFTMRPVR